MDPADEASADAQLVDFLERHSAAAADDRPAVAADQRVVHFLIALRAVERFGRRVFDLAHSFTTWITLRDRSRRPSRQLLKEPLDPRLDFIEMPGEEVIGAIDPAELLRLRQRGVEGLQLVARPVHVLGPLHDQLGLGDTAQLAEVRRSGRNTEAYQRRYSPVGRVRPRSDPPRLRKKSPLGRPRRRSIASGEKRARPGRRRAHPGRRQIRHRCCLRHGS